MKSLELNNCKVWCEPNYPENGKLQLQSLKLHNSIMDVEEWCEMHLIEIH